MFSAEEPKSIQKMFNQIASKYDLANTVLSLGTHLIWKNLLVKKAAVKPAMKILDCATGTGDIAFIFEKKSKGAADITGIDFSEKMLEQAKLRAEKNNSHVKFKFADIENLPFENESFDVVTISFGLRNVRNTEKALSELARVTKKGGQVLILEFGQSTVSGFKQAYGFYSEKILPFVGGLISGEKTAYKYLNESSAKFPCGENLCKLAQSLGTYKTTEFESLSLGIAYLYQFKV